MSRIAKKPVTIPSGVEVSIDGSTVKVKGSKGTLDWEVHQEVDVIKEDQELKFAPKNDSKGAMALAGTTRSLLNNMVIGVSKGFEKKLQLVGVGYRAQVQGKSLNLTLGFSHPVNVDIPEGISIETPKQNEIVIQGVDKQVVGQIAAEIRAFRPPEPYKGKGVRYADEQVARKEAKKK